MKPFNLEEAKAGAKVVTHDKRKVRILTFDAKGVFPIVALVLAKDRFSESAHTYTLSGRISDCPDLYCINKGLNLFMED